MLPLTFGCMQRWSLLYIIGTDLNKLIHYMSCMDAFSNIKTAVNCLSISLTGTCREHKDAQTKLWLVDI